MSNETIEVIAHEWRPIEVIVHEGTPIQINGIPARIKGSAIVTMAPENVSLAFAAESTAAEDRKARTGGPLNMAIKNTPDMVNHPPHYNSHPSGVECIQVTEHMSFCLGNAVKYIWRADLKHDAIEDLEKARWYLDREIRLRKSRVVSTTTGQEMAHE